MIRSIYQPHIVSNIVTYLVPRINVVYKRNINELCLIRVDGAGVWASPCFVTSIQYIFLILAILYIHCSSTSTLSLTRAQQPKTKLRTISQPLMKGKTVLCGREQDVNKAKLKGRSSSQRELILLQTGKICLEFAIHSGAKPQSQTLFNHVTSIFWGFSSCANYIQSIM